MLTSNTTSHLIAEHIIQMANSLHLKIVAEGVETAEQVAAPATRRAVLSGVALCESDAAAGVHAVAGE